MASRQNNNVPDASSSRNRLEFRTTRDGVVPSSIGALSRLTIDAAMKAALTHAGAKLVVEMDAGGTRVLLADGRTNQLIGGPDDLQKLGSIRTFVNRERKDAAGVEAAKDTTQLAFLSEKIVKDTTAGFEMKPVDSSYGAALRPLRAALVQMDENRKKLDENSSTSNREFYEPYIRRLFTGIGNAYTRTISALTRNESIKGLLQEELFAAGVPEWVHARFVSKTFLLDRTGELRKLFFPTDPSKGLSLSLREWRDPEFVAKQTPVLGNSILAYSFTNDDELLRALTGISAEVDLDDQENPSSAKLLKTKVAAMPIADNADRVIELGSRSRTGFKFPTPSMDTINGAMIALSTALLRVYSANLQSVDLVGDYYSTIVPGAVSREAVTPTNNFYVQWGKAVENSTVWLEAIKGGPKDLNLRQKIWRWIRMELRLSEVAGAGKALAKSLELKEDGSMPDNGHTSGKIPDDDPEALSLGTVPVHEEQASVDDEAINLLRPLRETELAFWTEFQNRVFPPTGGKRRQPVGLALTPLSPQGKSLISRVRTLSPYVAERMLSWLRSFSDERLQLAAIKVTNAEFDDLFSSSLDEDEAESVMDWAEQEAP